MRVLVVAFTCLALATALRAQSDPGFGDLNNTDANAVIKSLLARVAALEKRVDALENGSGVSPNSTTRKTTDPAAKKVLDSAVSARSTLSGYLDGFSRQDPQDYRIQYYKVKSNADWNAVVKTCKAFTSAMNDLKDRSADIGEDHRTTLEGLVRWGRGRVLYMVKSLGLNSQQESLLPVDFGSDIIPVDKPPEGR